MALALFATSNLEAGTPDQYRVDLRIEGLRSTKGNVLICLTANPKAFPDCSKDANATSARIAASEAATLSLTVARQGEYAVSSIHDENGNGKLDTSLMIPREGFGFSRNPAITFGPPKFASASFVVGPTGSRQSIKMKYML